MNKKNKMKYILLTISNIFMALVMECLSFMTINSLITFFDKSKLLLIPTLIPITAVIAKVFTKNIKDEKTRIQNQELLENILQEDTFYDEEIKEEEREYIKEIPNTNDFSYKYDGKALEREEQSRDITKTKKWYRK